MLNEIKRILSTPEENGDILYKVGLESKSGGTGEFIFIGEPKIEDALRVARSMTAEMYDIISIERVDSWEA